MISSAQRTHRGYVRKHNEDSILSHLEFNLFAVADGMGGHAAGDLVSQSIVSELSQLKLGSNNLQCSIDKIKATLVSVNKKIISGELFDDEELIAGSTIVIAYIADNICSCLWVGDSRLYIFRANKLYQITKDHSLVQEMLDSGQLSVEQAQSHPKSNVITRAVGVDKELKIDINQFEIQTGDKLLLCSDGLYNEVSSEVIISALRQDKTDHIANKLLGEALLSEASDNISIIVIEKH